MPISIRPRPALRSFLPVLLFLVNGFALLAQSPKAVLDTISLSTVKLATVISAQTGIYIDSSNEVTGDQFSNLPALYKIPLSMGRKLQAKYVSKSIYLQFSLRNDADSSSSIYFLPGFYCNALNLFKFNKSKHQFEAIPQLKGTKSKKENIVCHLGLEPGETATYITELNFVKTTVNTITPTLAREFYLPSLFSQLQNDRKLNSIITYLICGIMLMMIFYSFAGFYASRRMEFLYYSAYAFLLGIMFFFKAVLYKIPVESNFFFESYFDFILQAGGTIFYFMFLRSFTDAHKEFPLLDKVLYAQEVITIAGMLAFTVLHFFADNFPVQNDVENLVKYSWAASTVFFILFAISRKSYILGYLAAGHGFLLVFGFLSLYLISSPNRFNTMLTALVNDSLFWYEMGILLELVFFMIALSFKNKMEITLRAREKERLLMEYEKSVIERKIEILAAQQEERNRISADMHDELGSGVTAIRLMSELAKAKMKENTPVEIEKISSSANELISKMNTIIWTMKSSNDSVDSTIAYVRAYASEFLDNTNLKYTVEYPETIAPIELSGEKRRNIFLCIKEALNNIAKHAKATTVHIGFRIGPQLVITICDNGIGLNHEKMREFSNGLANMRKRMENIDGHFSIRNENGTIVTLTVPLV